MPYRLIPPDPSRRTPFYTVRGTEFGVYVERSTKCTDRKDAMTVLRSLRDEARRQFIQPAPQAPTFREAARGYLASGRSPLFIEPLIGYFGGKRLDEIDQAAVDRAAAILGANRAPQTSNRLVYTPVIAILRHAGCERRLRRPKTSDAGHRIEWLKPDEAFALLGSAAGVDPRLGALLTFLLYTGVRLSEALRLEWRDIDTVNQTAFIRRTKNGEALTVHLPKHVIAALGSPRTAGKVFGLWKGSRLYTRLSAAFSAAGIERRPGSAFHVLRHTHITWRRRFAGQDTRQLLDVGLHKSPRMIERYTHLDVSEEARMSDLLPTPEVS